MDADTTNHRDPSRAWRLLAWVIGLCVIAVLWAPPVSAAAVQTALFEDIDTDPGATQVVFDDYVSPALSNSFVGRVFDGQANPGTFTGFVAPSSANSNRFPLPPPVGVVVDAGNGPTDSDNFVIFEDAFTGLSVSDLFAGSFAGNTLSLSFFDPDQPAARAAVSGFAARVGGIAQTHSVRFFDAVGTELFSPAGSVATVSGGVTEIAFEAIDEDGLPLPVIHRVVFTTSFASSNNDAWVLGSFTGPTDGTDLAFTGFTTDLALIPEPGALVLLTLGTLSLTRRTRRDHA